MPIAAKTKRNFYQDSLALMRISQAVGARAGLGRVSLLMGTPANKDLLAQAGLLAAEVAAAMPADLMIVVEGEPRALEPALAEIERELSQRGRAPAIEHGEIAPRSIAMGLERLPGALLAQVSVPGPYAAAEAMKALRRGLHVFLFSDNVPLAEEQAIKRLAAKKSLLVMGPDCGTALIAGVPLGFANVVRRGAIGLVGASGTGLQEVSCRIHALGEGVSHGLGTGTRDVSAAVGGTTLLAGLALLGRDPATRVIVIVSKPPADAVADAALAAARACGKPVVVLFLGTKRSSLGGNLHAVATLEEAAATAVALVRRAPPALESDAAPPSLGAEVAALAPSQRYLRGLYSGGTYCTEAQCLWQDAGIATWSNAPTDKRYALPHGATSREHTAIDFGADEFTVGRPHPMIDFAARTERLAAEARDASVAVIVLDVVLGHGADADPAGKLAPAVRAARVLARQAGRTLVVVGFVCGTDGDPQGLAGQRAQLRDAGVHLAPTSTGAARLAARIVAGR